MPIRTRLALVSALLTFVILCSFALVVGSLTVHRLRTDFNHEVDASATDLAELLHIEETGNAVQGYQLEVTPNLHEFAASEHAFIRILYPSGAVFKSTPGAPNVGLANDTDVDGYRVDTIAVHLNGPTGGVVLVQYGRPLGDIQPTIARLELLLVLGVLAGTGLALLAGASIARRAMQPIARLTGAAAQITRTRDAGANIPQPEADDEVAELARTLQGMLRSLDDAHAETEATLARQRRFVADASHELRTPLTSVLANLELLAESLHGEEADAARSALKSSRRMRRLVADLLLLARGDAGRSVPHEPLDLAQVVLDAAAELGTLSADHELSLDVHPAVVQGDHDELTRLALNLIENALRHTPPGSSIWVTTGAAADHATLVVEDDGPGVPPDLAPTLFERFVRGADGAPRRDGTVGGSFGLGLAIVRAVAESHGGSVTLEHTRRDGVTHGARFLVRLPPAPADSGAAGEPRTPALSRPAG
ncbi:MAG TPA: HAMP domain-containing sensor histidine kinase [Solirubrobacteraceae bacterium]|nr:HAMP domain-containing sensor histidine kinase [Solirubrobacteraceae bacterium]